MPDNRGRHGRKDLASALAAWRSHVCVHRSARRSVSGALGTARPGLFTLLRHACLVGVPLILCGCVAPDSQVPPFARVPYEPISRQAIAEIALREWRLFGSRRDDEPEPAEGVLPQKPERAEGLWQRVGEYWWIGLDRGAVESKW